MLGVCEVRRISSRADPTAPTNDVRVAPVASMTERWEEMSGAECGTNTENWMAYHLRAGKHI